MIKRILLVLLFVALLPIVVSAQTGLVPCGDIGAGEPACELCHIFVLFNNIVTFLLIPNTVLNAGFPIVLAIAGILILWSGFLYITSLGDPSKLKRSKDLLVAIGMGLLIVYGAWAAVNTLTWFGLIRADWYLLNDCPLAP